MYLVVTERKKFKYLFKIYVFKYKYVIYVFIRITNRYKEYAIIKPSENKFLKINKNKTDGKEQDKIKMAYFSLIGT